MSSPNEQLIRRVVDAFDARRIQSVVIGGQAVNYHGHIRFTRDVDFTVAVEPWKIDPVLDAVKAAGLQLQVSDPHGFVAQVMVLPCLDISAGMGVDISFVSSPYLQNAIERATPFPIAGRMVRFLTLEDLLLQKVIANRPQDRIDVVELLARHTKVDFSYIRHWLGQFEQIAEEPLISRFDELLEDSSR